MDQALRLRELIPSHVELKMPHELCELSLGIAQQKMEVAREKNKAVALDAAAILLERLGQPDPDDLDDAMILTMPGLGKKKKRSCRQRLVTK